MIRTFAAGDGPGIAAAWTAAAPADPIGYDRLRDLVLLDRNFDPAGLWIAEEDGDIVGAAYAVRRLIAADGADLEPGSGWIPFFFVHPDHRRRGLGRELLTKAMDWLRDQGRTEVFFSSYTPNYFLPGLDVVRYPAALALTEQLGFRTQYQAVAMDRGLVGYAIPDDVRERIRTLEADGYRFGTPTGDELTELIAIARSEFNPDWARAIREAVVAGMPLDRIVAAYAPDRTVLGWAMHGTYEGVLDRFGPFGVLPASRGTGLGKVLLHLTLQRMVGLGAHSAWFLWTGEQSAAGQLYLKTGFTITRKFSILRASLVPADRKD
ncbi:N-acetylglutamate synthase-like GNAT family acetyltransferase [Kribbella amoyensis]|uniref:N-acetylglutamate synthase-like GNAT family acetyltransferase n=1 Tax=Kribbella amoyensis TaxID=996641 RepID=A0A561B920_9ACTN|nr:GNAT family N-acetyltransferase [Kribbella amoyensis]TWD75267.1 N-acetylglutamate synthase-like GNAT family acetyltransferase [Kribbella amoyensis]